jgi:hypothetical protein
MSARQWLLSPSSFVQAPARGQVLHPAVGPWVEERDEALASREVAVADRAQRNRRRFLRCVGFVEAHLPAHPERSGSTRRAGWRECQ